MVAAQLSPHGLSVRPSADGRHQLYVVNHGGQESVEIFELDARGPTPALAWTGSAVLPEGASGNAVAPLPEGGFVVTKMYDTRRKDQVIEDFIAHRVTGLVLEWRPPRAGRSCLTANWPAANGVAASDDGAWIYAASWTDGYVVRLPRAGGAGEPVKTPLGFLVDNLRIAPDGSILAAGQDAPIEEVLAPHAPGHHAIGSAVARIDPLTMESEIVLRLGATAEFSHGTTGLVVGDELWLETYRGDRIACLPLPARLKAAASG